MLWLLVHRRGRAEEGKTGSLAQKNHLYAFKYEHIGRCVVVRLLLLKALKRLLRLDVASLNLNVREATASVFVFDILNKVGHFQTSSVSQKEKLEGLSPLSLLHGVALLTVVQIFSMTYSCTSAMLNKAWYRSTSSF